MSGENLKRSWRRLDGVDLLRGLSILLVLLNHVNIRLLISRVPYARGIPASVMTPLVWNGQRGVQIFFAISGFLITSTTLRRWGSLDRVGVLDFYKMRFARIAPLLFALLAVLATLHFIGVKNFVVGAKTGGLGRALEAALTFQVNRLEATRGYLPGSWDVLWSLSVEEMFYLFFPLLCQAFGRGRLLIAILLAFVIAGPFARTVLAHGNEIWVEYSYLGSMDAIALGCLTAMVAARERFSIGTLRVLRGIGIAVLAFSLGFPGAGKTGLDMTVVAMGACLVILWAAGTGWRSPRWASQVVRMGRRSYEIYLTHMFVMFLFLAWLVRLGKPMWFVPVFFGGAILVSGVVGEIVARVYSEPMNRWLRTRWGDDARRMGSAIQEGSLRSLDQSSTSS